MPWTPPAIGETVALDPLYLFNALPL
jgi:hypothetical protein